MRKSWLFPNRRKAKMRRLMAKHQLKPLTKREQRELANQAVQEVLGETPRPISTRGQ